MYSQSDLEDAVAGGAVTAGQAASLRNFIAARNGVPTADEEHVRLLLGFNDIFVFIACGFALVAVGWVGSLIPLEAGGFGGLPTSSPIAALFVAAASWGLAEIFTRQRHMALPSILLVVTFTWGVFFTLILLIFSAVGVSNLGAEGATIVAFLSLAAGAAAAALHWKRFRVPVTIATGVGFAILALVALISLGVGRSPQSANVMMILLLLAGIGAFLYATWWDSKDPLRQTEKSDVAFWLHWLGAGLIVNCLTQLFGLSGGVTSVGGAIGVLVLYVLFALVALAVDRRVILIAGLTPLLLAIRSLLNEGSSGRMDGYDRFGSGGGYDVDTGSGYGGSASGFGGSTSDFGSSPYSSAGLEGTMITVVIIGLILLLLAIFWSPLRRMVVGVLPEGLRARLPATGQQTADTVQTFE